MNGGVLSCLSFYINFLVLMEKIICCNCHIHSVNVGFVGVEFKTGVCLRRFGGFIPLDLLSGHRRLPSASVDSTTAGQ